VLPEQHPVGENSWHGDTAAAATGYGGMSLLSDSSAGR
jgi:hypothetical protein